MKRVILIITLLFFSSFALMTPSITYAKTGEQSTKKTSFISKFFGIFQDSDSKDEDISQNNDNLKDGNAEANKSVAKNNKSSEAVKNTKDSNSNPGETNDLKSRTVVPLASAELKLKRTVKSKTGSDTNSKDNLADIIEGLLPVVVNISTVQSAPYFNIENEEYYDEAVEGVKSLGSGFIVNSKGYIVTNNHVVEGANEITVVLQDKTKYKAEIIGSDKRSDIALLKIDSEFNKEFPYVRFGNSENVRIGEQIIVVGNPFNLGSSVSTGIISAKGRNISYGPFSGLLQTDAAINQGNSGGPMFNMEGEVIGISSAIYSPSGGSVGVGFAIPSNTAIPIIEELEKYGYITRGWLGVGVREIDDSVIEALSLDENYGVVVTRVVFGSPADNAGIRVSDIITKFADREVRDINDLMKYVANTEINSDVEIKFFREGKEMKETVKIVELKDVNVSNVGEEDLLNILLTNSSNFYGMNVIGLTDDLKSKLYINPTEFGLLVIAVERGSEPSNKGIKSRDIIQSINQRSVYKAEDLIEGIDEAKSQNKQNVLLMIKRDDFVFPMTIKVQ